MPLQNARPYWSLTYLSFADDMGAAVGLHHVDMTRQDRPSTSYASHAIHIVDQRPSQLCAAMPGKSKPTRPLTIHYRSPSTAKLDDTPDTSIFHERSPYIGYDVEGPRNTGYAISQQIYCHCAAMLVHRVLRRTLEFQSES